MVSGELWENLLRSYCIFGAANSFQICLHVFDYVLCGGTSNDDVDKVKKYYYICDPKASSTAFRIINIYNIFLCAVLYLLYPGWKNTVVDMADGDPTFSLATSDGPTEAHTWLTNFWPKVMTEIKTTKQVRVHTHHTYCNRHNGKVHMRSCPLQVRISI